MFADLHLSPEQFRITACRSASRISPTDIFVLDLNLVLVHHVLQILFVALLDGGHDVGPGTPFGDEALLQPVFPQSDPQFCQRQVLVKVLPCLLKFAPAPQLLCTVSEASSLPQLPMGCRSWAPYGATDGGVEPHSKGVPQFEPDDQLSCDSF